MVSQTLVDAPARKPRVGGLFTVADVIQVDRLGIVQQIDFISDGCTFPQPALGLCYGPEIIAEKTGEGIDVSSAIGEPFALYAGVECYLDAGSDYAARAGAIMDQGLERALEQALAIWADAAVDIPTATLTGAIAAIDQALDADYLGQGIILMSRADAVLAAAEDAIMWGINGPVTINGTPIVTSGWIGRGEVYGLGAVTVLRGNRQVIDTQSPNTNREWSVVEEVFGLLVDCEFRVKSTVTPVP